MKYALKNKNYCTFEVIEQNKMAPRAYFIPFSDRERSKTAPLGSRYVSDMVDCLSGEWDFRFYEIPKQLEDEFDSDALSFDKITVPSVWQYSGYLKPAYINSGYPFGFFPPAVPEEEELGKYRVAYNKRATYDARGQYNSIGVYRKKFTIDTLDKSYTIAFLGVTPCLDLFVNGKYVGYSEGSHNTAEFLLNDFLIEGENELIAAVHRFSTGTYLEAQDMFRNNGIFRDVLLYKTAPEHINDFKVETIYKGGKYDLAIEVYVENAVGGSVIGLEFDGKAEKANIENGVAKFTFADLSVDEWSAETPVLYDLTIDLNGREFVTERIGLKRVEIQGDTFLFNGKKIKMFGVNHHDTHPEKGYAMSLEDIKRDILLMKEYNVNAVRTSHYPPDPVFLKLCNEYGLYVIDEADIETHGACECGDVGKLSNDLKWCDHYLDRVKRMYFRDRNNCSVTMWSLGNESGGIACQQACDRYLKTVTTIPVHYEGACREKIIGFDVVSEMYTSIEGMKKKAATRFKDARRMKPYYLCEYCHAMGVGPGALEDYVQLFLSEDIYMGGCIWEWADHSVYHKDTGNYTYGGDHGEYRHDGVFCVDGLFRSDRKPYTSAFLMKTAYRPVRAKHIGGGKVEFYNVLRFKNTDWLTVTAAVSVNGTEGKKKKLDISLAPEGKTVIAFEYPTDVDAFLNITYTETATGRIVAEEQVVFNEVIPASVFGDGKAKVEQKGKRFTAEFENGTRVVFDLGKGQISSYNVNGVEMINQAPQNRLGALGVYPEIYRAPTDNDMHVKAWWKLRGFDRFRISAVRSSVSQADGVYKLKFSYSLRKGLCAIAKIKDVYTVYPDGSIAVDSAFSPRIAVLIPRIGKVFEFGKEFDRVRYYGRGEMENYPDMKAHTMIGLFESEGDFGVKMISPQQSGERMDVRWAEVTNGKVGVKFTAVGKAFGLNVNHYSEADLESWKHIIDYCDKDTTYVNIDGFVGGIGSNSCGPLPEKQYRIPQKQKLSYSFVFSPIVKVK